MNSFDKKLHEMSKELKVSEDYKKKIDETLLKLPLEEEPASDRPHVRTKRVVWVVIRLVLLVLCSGFICASVTNANFFETFKKTIMDFFHSEKGNTEDNGVKSRQMHSQSKADLMLEIKESVIDRSNMYLLVKITASTTVEFNDKVGFEYFAFSEGENFDTNKLISGARDCKLLEVSEDENAAIFVVSLTAASEIRDGVPVSVCFKNMMEDPYGENPKMLVEGMWSLSLAADYTITEQLDIEGSEEMTYDFLGDPATVQSIHVTPLGLEFQSSISSKAYEASGISFTRQDIRLNMMDGSEIKLMNRDMEEPEQVSSSSEMYSDTIEDPYFTRQFEFEETLNINQILGITIDDLYIPFKKLQD